MPLRRPRKGRRSFLSRTTFIESLGGFAGAEPHLARLLVRATAEKQKPSHERLREYGQARLASVEQQMFSTAPVYKALDMVELATSLRMMREKLGPDNAMVKQVLGGRSPEAVAKEAIGNSHLDDPAYRKHLYQGGVQAVEQSKDLLIVTMRNIDPAARALRKQWDDEVESVLRENGTLIAKARFAVQGTDMYPDATFTLRLSYGVMKGYRQNGEHDSLFPPISAGHLNMRRDMATSLPTSCRNPGLTRSRR